MGFYAGTPNTRYQNTTYCDGLFKKQAYRTIILYIQTAPLALLAPGTHANHQAIDSRLGQ